MYLKQLESTSANTALVTRVDIERLRAENAALRHENRILQSGVCRSTQSSYAPSSGSGDTYSNLSCVNFDHSLSGSDAKNFDDHIFRPVVDCASDRTWDQAIFFAPCSSDVVRQSLRDTIGPWFNNMDAVDWNTHQQALWGLNARPLGSLKPTGLQLSMPHHPSIDLVPSPQLRNTLILAESLARAAFFNQVGFETCEWIDAGHLLIWGTEWHNECAWEFSSPILSCWVPTLLGIEWVERANFWRHQRGLPSL